MRRPLTSTLFPYTTLFRSSPRIMRLTVFAIVHCHFVSSPRVHHTGATADRIMEFWLQIISFCDTTVVLDRKSTRLNSSHVRISYAVFCLKKKKYQIYSPVG